MGKRPTLPESARIWAGWQHLFQNVTGLDDPSFQAVVLDLGLLDREQRTKLARLYHLDPTLFEVAMTPKAYDRAAARSLLVAVGTIADPGARFILKRKFLEVVEGARSAGRMTFDIPHLPAPMPPASASPFQLADVVRLMKIRPLIEAFHDTLDDMSPLGPEAWWGGVLMSAMINGALLKTAFLCELPTALSAAEPQLRWIDLPLPSPDDRQGLTLPRRWFPDPTTRLLCARGLRSGLYPPPALDGFPHRKVYRLLMAYARARGFESHMPSGLREIAKALKTRLHHHLPAWAVEYLTDRQPSASLPPWAWQRLIDPPTRMVAELTPRERLVSTVRGSTVMASRVMDAERGDEAAADESLWPQQLRTLAEHVRAPDETRRAAIESWRQQDGSTLLPSVKLLSHWVTDWLMTRGAGRKLKARRGLYALTNAIGSRLVGQLGCTDPLDFKQPAAYAAIYQAALEDTGSDNVRATVARALRSFHDYLVARRKAPEIDPMVLAVGARSRGIADANIISLDLFHRVCRRVVEEATRLHGPDVATELELIAGLGYFCGCRRSEAIGVTTEGILAVPAVAGLKTAYETWVSILPNGLRGVKTRAGHRDLPLHWLCPEVYLHRFRAWWKRREAVARATGCSVPLFPSFVRANGMADDTDPRLEIITHALQHCADDATLRFHHLRHSFASFLLLMLWLAEEEDLSILPDWFLPTKHDQRRWKKALTLRRKLLGKAPTNTRTILQISALMGHSGTDISFSTYIHLADLVAGRLVRRLTRPHSNEALAAISGYSALYIRNLRRGFEYRGRTEYEAAAFIDRIADRLLGKCAGRPTGELVDGVDFARATPVDMPRDPFERMLHVARALNALESGAGSKAVAARFGCGESELLDWQACLHVLPQGILRRDVSGTVMSNSRGGIDIPVGKALELARRASAEFDRLRQTGLPGAISSVMAQRKLDDILDEFPTAWVAGSYLEFETDSVPMAKRWCWWIDRLGLWEGVVAEHSASTGLLPARVDAKRSSVPSAERQLAHWRNALGIRAIVAANSKVGTGTRGRVRISIRIRDVSHQGEAFRKVTALYGIRFVLAMKRVLT